MQVKFSSPYFEDISVDLSKSKGKKNTSFFSHKVENVSVLPSASCHKHQSQIKLQGFTFMSHVTYMEQKHNFRKALN